MNARAERTAAMLRVRREMGLAGRRRKRIPQQRWPTTIARSYAAALLEVVAMGERALGPLLRALPELLERARRERTFADAHQDEGEGAQAAALLEATKASLLAALHPAALVELARRFAHRVSAHNRVELGRQLRAALGVDVLMTDRAVGALIDGFAAENAALIRDLPERMLGEVQRIVVRGVQRGSLTRDVTAEIEARVGVTRNRAKVIARDQVGSLVSQINAARQREIGIERFRWHTVGDERVRPEHRALNDKVFRYDDLPSEGLPGTAIMCRCYAEPVVDDLFG